MSDKRVVVVTGAAGGIGSGLAGCFAADGDRVVVADLDTEKAAEVADRLAVEGGEALALPLDVTDPTSAEKMVAAVVERFGRLDVLVNNAGMYGKPSWTGPVLDVDLDDVDRLFAVNVKGSLICARAVAPAMSALGRGRIVNVSSMGAYMLGGAYAASKLAVHQLTWQLAHELGPSGITVNCVAPGTMDTPSNRRTNGADPAVLQDRIERTFIVKRLGTPADIHGAIRYFASPEAEWCTGQVLLVNGGVNVRL